MDAQILLFFCIGEKGEGRLAASISKGRPDVFSGELCFREKINFEDAADLFGGKFLYPKDIEAQGFDTGQYVEEKALIWYKNSDGSFGISIKFKNKNKWNGEYGACRFGINNITGDVKYLGKATGDYRISLKGEFSLGNYNAAMNISLASDGMNTQTVLSLSFEKTIVLTKFIDSVSGANAYDLVPLPKDYVKPESAFEMEAVLNLTERTFFLSGKYKAKSGAAASLLLYFSKQGEEYAWLMAAQLKDFSLSDISPALEDADRFLGLDNVTATLILSNINQEISALEEVLHVSDIATLRRGMTFQIDLELREGFLKEVLIISKSCKISGYIPKDETEEIILSGHADEVVFLQFLKLTEIGINIRKNTRDKLFSFSLNGNIHFDFKELNMPDFNVGLTIEENKTYKKVVLEGKVGKPVENPLGIPNTTLEELCFYAISQKPITDNDGQNKERIYFRGSVKIANIILMANVYFVERQPAVIDITIRADQKLSISALVEKYFSFSWPDILDIQLYDGRICYCKKEIVLDGTVYSVGFHAEVNTQIFFFPKFMFFIDIGDKNRLRGGAQIEQPVELAFIKFYTEKSEKEHGPEVSIEIEEHQASFSLSTNVAIFSEEIGEVEISVKKKRLEGTFIFPDKLPISGKVKFSIDDKGVSLGEVDIGNFPKMDFELPKMNLGNGKCKIKIVDMPKIKTVPKVESRSFNMNKNGVKIIFDVILRIKSETSFSEDGEDDIVSLTFRELELNANKNDLEKPTFDSLMDTLEDNIVKIIKDAGEQLLDPEFYEDALSEEGMKRLVKFLTIEGISWGINELVSYLICQGLEKLLAEALVSALTSVGEKLWEGLGYALMLGGMLGSLLLGGIFKAGKKAPKKNEDEPEKNPDTPDRPEVIFREEKLIIRWNSCEKAEGYCPIVSRMIMTEQQEQSSTINLILAACNNTEYEIAGSDEESLYLASYGFEYFIRIYVWNNDGAAESEETCIYLPQRPKGMKVRYRCEEKSLYIVWNKVEKAEEYEVELWYENADKISLTCGEDTREMRCDNIEPDQSIGISVCGKTENVTGPSSVLDAFYLYDLQPPAGVCVYNTDEGIVLEWQRVTNADRYRISCRDDMGREIIIPECWDTQVIVSSDYLSEKVSYTMKVQSATEEIEGRFSEEVNILWRPLSIPEISEFICREDGKIISVMTIDDVKCRQIIYPDGRVIVLDEQQTACEWDIKENAKVRLFERARQGKWSSEISTKPMKTPEDMKISFQGEMMCVEWKDTGDNCVYGIEISTGDYRNKEELIEGTTWQTDISAIPDSGLIRVFLYAIDREDARRRSDSVEVYAARGN